METESTDVDEFGLDIVTYFPTRVYQKYYEQHPEHGPHAHKPDAWKRLPELLEHEPKEHKA